MISIFSTDGPRGHRIVYEESQRKVVQFVNKQVRSQTRTQGDGDTGSEKVTDETGLQDHWESLRGQDLSVDQSHDEG